MLNLLLVEVNLKGLCYKDIAVLGQFRAKVVTWCLNPYTKFSISREKNIKPISSGSTSHAQDPVGSCHNIYIFIFVVIVLKLEKVGQLFQV